MIFDTNDLASQGMGLGATMVGFNALNTLTNPTLEKAGDKVKTRIFGSTGLDEHKASIIMKEAPKEVAKASVTAAATAVKPAVSKGNPITGMASAIAQSAVISKVAGSASKLPWRRLATGAGIAVLASVIISRMMHNAKSPKKEEAKKPEAKPKVKPDMSKAPSMAPMVPMTSMPKPNTLPAPAA